MTIERIADKHRVPCTRTGPTADDERVICGKLGHLWQDGEKLMVCFTDDGMKRPLTVRKKKAAIAKLGDLLASITQNAQAEFCGEILQDHTSVETAIRVLRVKRFKVTKGVSRPMPWNLSTQQTRGTLDARNH